MQTYNPCIFSLSARLSKNATVLCFKPCIILNHGVLQFKSEHQAEVSYLLVLCFIFYENFMSLCMTVVSILTFSSLKLAAVLCHFSMHFLPSYSFLLWPMSRTDPKRLANTLGTENEESCTTYNMLKVWLFPLVIFFVELFEFSANLIWK